MIYSLTGTLIEKAPGQAVVRCGGVGYLALMPQNAVGALPAPGAEVGIFTHLHVAENDVSLFGFIDEESREMFRLLTGVSGVGPKVGLAILSALTPAGIALAVAAGDFKALTAAAGVGPKLAQRLVLELKDKLPGGMAAGGLALDSVAVVGKGAAGGAAQQAVAALVSLGYTQSEAAAAVAPVDPGLPVAEIVRLALREMGRK